MRNIFCFLMALLPLVSYCETFTIRTKSIGEDWQERQVNVEAVNGVVNLKILSSEISDETLEIIPHFARAKGGEEGYIILSTGALVPFKKGEKDKIYIPWSPSKKDYKMRADGMKTPRGTFLAIYKKLPHEKASKISVKNGEYQFSSLYDMKRCGFKAYEDIEIEYRFLKKGDDDYSGMAREYRKYLLDTKQCVPIVNRLTPELDYATDAIEIRIRQAWKPVPSPVEEQTLETEPPVKAKMTFDKVGEFVKALKVAGVEKAQICLVGWNVGGHDGRWPTPFPVEPKLGGEAKLRELIKLTQSLGYQIVCHTNSTDIYSISPEWKNALHVVKRQDGSLAKNGTWGGGRMYDVCPKFAWEYAQKSLPRIAELGFKGLHYIDVISTKPPFDCHDPRHPCTRGEGDMYMNKIMQLARELFGGSASEGNADYVCATQDYALYCYFNLFKQSRGMVERIVPFWEIAFHGIMLHTTSTETVNYPAKGDMERLKLYEFGGRPLFYLYSRFRDAKNHSMGSIDIRADTPEEMAYAVECVKRGWQDYKNLARLQRVFLHSHTEIAKDVFRTLYENGTEIISNYSKKDFSYKGKIVKSMKFEVFE